MKPTISGVSPTNPSVAGAADGKIVISGLAPGTYIVTFSKDGVNNSLTGTADADGILTIGTLTAGTYGTIVLTPTGVEAPESSEPVEVTLTEPAAPVASNDGNENTGSGSTSGTGSNENTGAGSVSSESGGKAGGPSKKEAVINNFLSASHSNADARESVIVNSESIINDLKNLGTGSAAVLPATKQLLEIFVSESICHVENTTTVLLEKLKPVVSE